MTKKIIISLAVIAALALGVLYGKGLLSVHQGFEPPASLAVLKLEKTQKPAPDVHFTDAVGARQGLDAFHGRYVLVNLWATWCGPCVNELPSLARLAEFAPGLKVVAINTDHEKVDAAGFLKSHGAGALPVYLDSDRMMLRSFVVPGLPTTILIGPDGKEVARAEGPADWGSADSVAYFKRITGS
ncbi:MAG TPA: TlpA disulfide reductase family protein [Rhizomicrobium sp.]|jgi:thiol-disulfide isomerase/thioredoxin|nr:TlpA disulfide reductase family protein [Rhizomicrobium sp.]